MLTKLCYAIWHHQAAVMQYLVYGYVPTFITFLYICLGQTGHWTVNIRDLLCYLNHFYIWLMSLQLSCGDTFQIWTSYSTGNQYFHVIENGKIRGIENICLVNLTPGYKAHIRRWTTALLHNSLIYYPLDCFNKNSKLFSYETIL